MMCAARCSDTRLARETGGPSLFERLFERKARHVLAAYVRGKESTTMSGVSPASALGHCLWRR